MNIFGNWNVHGTFQTAEPYPHVVIDNFFTPETLQILTGEFGTPTHDKYWHRYWNPIEKKYALNNFEEKPGTQRVFDVLQTKEFVDRLIDITSISTLQSDPYLHGAGLHYHPRGGKLDMHLDYSVHPVSGMERMLNLIVYLNDTWDECWGGALELWDKDFTHGVKKVYPYSNRAILFRTSDISYHGLPTPIQCPETIGRKSLAIYYMSPLQETSIVRKKAAFRPLPDQPVTDKLLALYTLRESRILREDDLWESWDTDGNGYW
jgi:hypothetical protein